MKIKDILTHLETSFPLEKQESWDHSGLQVGNIENECDRVLICLNVDQHTIQQAIDHHCQLIVSHHPFLFHPVKEIDQNTTLGHNIIQLIKHDVTVYSMHTNYDALKMNTKNKKKMGCINIQPVDFTGISRVGQLKESMTLDQLIQKLKQQFNLPYIRICGNKPDLVHTISLCAGSGHDYINEALDVSDVFITGDLTYTHAMDIILRKQGCVIELPHFIEEAFKKDIQSYILIDSIISDESDYFQVL